MGVGELVEAHVNAHAWACPCRPLQGGSSHPASGQRWWYLSPASWWLYILHLSPAALGSQGHSGCSLLSADLGSVQLPRRRGPAQRGGASLATASRPKQGFRKWKDKSPAHRAVDIPGDGGLRMS